MPVTSDGFGSSNEFDLNVRSSVPAERAPWVDCETTIKKHLGDELRLKNGMLNSGVPLAQPVPKSLRQVSLKSLAKPVAHISTRLSFELLAIKRGRSLRSGSFNKAASAAQENTR